MIATFTWRGAAYEVSGWLWSRDGAGNGMIVSREDGRSIRGATTHPGMVQTGLSRGLERAARAALERARASDRTAVARSRSGATSRNSHEPAAGAGVAEGAGGAFVTLTDVAIRALRERALERGDGALADLCSLALRGEATAREGCAEAIRSERGRLAYERGGAVFCGNCAQRGDAARAMRPNEMPLACEGCGRIMR